MVEQIHGHASCDLFRKAGGFSNFVTIHLTVSNQNNLFPLIKPFLYYPSRQKFVMERRVLVDQLVI
jgi:hypothetical protein